MTTNYGYSSTKDQKIWNLARNLNQHIDGCSSHLDLFGLDCDLSQHKGFQNLPQYELKFWVIIKIWNFIFLFYSLKDSQFDK